MWKNSSPSCRMATLLAAAVLIATSPLTSMSLIAEAQVPDHERARSELEGSQIGALEYRLLVHATFSPTTGMRIDWVVPDGPAARLSLPNFFGPITLEPGDIITHVDGRFVPSALEYQAVMSGSGGLPVRLTVRDVRTGRVQDLHAQPVATPAIAPPPPHPSPDNRQVPPSSVPARSTAVKIVLVGQTNDPSIGPMNRVSVQRLQNLLLNVPGIDAHHIHMLGGDQVTSQQVLATVDRLTVHPEETLFFYYTGHGAYDPRAAIAGQQAHFLQLPTGDLPRYVLIERLRAKQARLTILITDSCNAPAFARIPTLVPADGRFPESNTMLEHLLHDYAGFLDVNSSSQNQLAWCASGVGGLFTDALVETSQRLASAGSSLSWEELLGRSGEATNRNFLLLRTRMIHAPAYDVRQRQNQAMIAGQFAQSPQVFSRAVWRTH